MGWGCAERPLSRRELLLEATFLDLDQNRGAREEGEIDRQKDQERVEEPVRENIEGTGCRRHEEPPSAT